MSISPQNQADAVYGVESHLPSKTIPCSSVDVHRAFQEYRSYVIHEDALIGERLQRLLTIQGLLFAAEATLLPKFGDLLPSLFDHSNELTTTYVRLFLYGTFALVISLIGGLSAHFVLPALQAAREAIENLNKVWENGWATEARNCKLPELLGGGAVNADKNGHRHILHIAKWFRGIWLVFFCAILASILFFSLHLIRHVA